MIDRTAHSMETPAPVRAEERQQAGYPIAVANCPACGMQVAATDFGKVLCRCGLWLKMEQA